MELRDHIIDFTRQYLQTRLTHDNDATDLTNIPFQYLTELYPHYLTYEGITQPLNAFATKTAKTLMHKYRDPHADKLLDFFVRAGTIRNQHDKFTRDLERRSLTNEYLTVTLFNGYAEMYEDVETDQPLLDALVWRTSVFVKESWALGIMYALDNLYIASHPGALQKIDYNLDAQQAQWFQQLTAWFMQLQTMCAKLAA